MKTNNNMCAGMETKLAELLLEPETASATVKAHVETCEGCRSELEELRATMTVLDAWEAPAPNPYFMTRFEARFREEKQAAPASWLERLRARFTHAPRMQARPLAAMALTLCLLVGGGTYLDVYLQAPPASSPDTAVVGDLQTLDNNQQVLDQLEDISGDQN
jgi:anti-sigma factor RsiW